MPRHPFRYHAPTDGDVAIMQTIGSSIEALYDVIEASLPPSAEHTLAIRQLQLVRFWVNTAVILTDHPDDASVLVTQAPPDHSDVVSPFVFTPGSPTTGPFGSWTVRPGWTGESMEISEDGILWLGVPLEVIGGASVSGELPPLVRTPNDSGGWTVMSTATGVVSEMVPDAIDHG